MAFTSIGKGGVGYVGHVYVDETVTNAILAMCFWPGSRDPPVPGTGVPPVSVSGGRIWYILHHADIVGRDPQHTLPNIPAMRCQRKRMMVRMDLCGNPHRLTGEGTVVG